MYVCSFIYIEICLLNRFCLVCLFWYIVFTILMKLIEWMIIFYIYHTNDLVYRYLFVIKYKQMDWA